jgi:hypothetical protein
MLMRSGIPGEAAAASTTPGDRRARSMISVKAGRRSGGSDPGRDRQRASVDADRCYTRQTLGHRGAEQPNTGPGKRQAHDRPRG